MTEISQTMASDRDRLVLAMLPHVPFDGWSDAAVQAAAGSIGLDAGNARVLLPDASAAIRHFVKLADRMMVDEVTAAITPAMKVREKIALAVRLRLQRWTPYREAVRRAVPRTLLRDPARVGSQLYGTVDAIWRAIGDRSVDFNFYTKRALLGGVYASTFLYWLDDRSEGCAETWAFLDRRIADVLRVPKAQQAIRDRLSRLPDPFALIRRFRRAS